MKRRTLKISLEVIVLTVLIVTVAIIAGYLGSNLISSANGDGVQLRQISSFDEFERWFGVTPRGKQLFVATQQLLRELEKNPRDLQGVAEGIKCPFSEDQRQDILSVGISYQIWQEIHILQDEVGKISPGLSKDDFVAEIARLEGLLKAELKKS